MNTPHVIGVIQARLSSSRLPGKVLMPIAGRPLLQVLVERLRPARVDEWWLATSEEPADALTAAWGEALGLRVHRGALEDVLSRFTHIVALRRPRWVVRVTADDPFMDAGALDRMLDAAERMDGDLLAGGPESGFPLGYIPEVARGDTLLRAAREIPAGQDYHRSHVLSWLYETGGARPFPMPDSWPRRPDWRWTVDTPADLGMARAAFACFGERWATASYPEMVALLDRRPEIAAMNRGVRQKTLTEG